MLFFICLSGSLWQTNEKQHTLVVFWLSILTLIIYFKHNEDEPPQENMHMLDNIYTIWDTCKYFFPHILPVFRHVNKDVKSCTMPVHMDQLGSYQTDVYENLYWGKGKRGTTICQDNSNSVKNFTLWPIYFMLPSATSMPTFSITNNQS
jgi:hypothetical protein